MGYFDDANYKRHGFLRSPDATITQIDEPSGVDGTVLSDINSKKVSVGYFTDSGGHIHSFIRSRRGRFKRLDPAHSGATYASSINDAGLIAGSYNDRTGVRHGFVRSP